MNQVELIDKRKPREKHFLNQDGTITAKVYDRDVHFEKNGHYEDIDTKIISNKNVYENKTNSFITKFDKTNVGFIDVSKDGFYLKLFPKDINALEVTKKDNIISYKDAINDIEFTYKVEPSRLKEIIKLNCKETVPEKITYYVDTNLTLSIENTKIVAKNGNDKVFVIDTPFMEDSAGNKNNNISYELINNEDIYELNLVYDLSWIKDKNTPFPVFIDPTITNDNNSVYDTYIKSNESDKNFDEREYFMVYTNGYLCRSLLKFDLPQIATGDTIINATAYINTRYSENPNQYDGDERKYYVSVHEITRDWDEKTVTWDSFNNSYNEKVEDVFLPKANSVDDPTNLQSNAFDLTNLVKKWYSGSPNYGVLLKKFNENLEAYTNFIDFSSKTFDVKYESNVRPSLEITYRNDSGLENYMTYKSLDFTNGSSHINLLNGNLTMCLKVNDTVGGKLPINLSLVYNTNDVLLQKNYGFGIGYRLNFFEFIEEKVINNKKYILYSDGDGTCHYFSLKGDEYIDEDGLNLTAIIIDAQYIIKDKNGTQYIFTKLESTKWYLTKIIDENNAENNIIYDNNYKIVKIKDSNNVEINITYDDNKITFASKYKTFEVNYQNGNPIAISSKLGVMSINYNANGLIDEIIDINGLGYKYQYYNVSPYKIFKLSELDESKEVGKEITFEYGYNMTKLISNSNEVNTFLFNEYGNLIGLTNLDNENNLNYAFGQKSKYYNENQDNSNVKLNNKLIEEILPIKYSKNYISNSSFEDPSESLGVLSPVAAEIVGIDNACSGRNVYEYGTFGYFEFFAPEKGGDYIFSGYFKNEHPLNITVSATNSRGTAPIGQYILPENEEFSKEEIILNIPDNVGIIGVEIETETRGFIDDIQLEKGTIANYHNYICNSDFSENLRTWNVSSIEELTNANISPLNDVIEINDETKYLKLIAGPTISTKLWKNIKLPGKANDTYCLSFWYKNSGIVPTFKLDKESDKKAYVNISFKNGDQIKTHKSSLAIHSSEWLFFSEVVESEIDYEYIEFEIVNDYNVNELLVTNFSLNKDAPYNRIIYDDNGGVTSVLNNNKGTSYKYDETNKLISMSNLKENSIIYEYDALDKNIIKNSISSRGIITTIKRDNNGNPIKTIVSNTKILDDISSGELYYIKEYGTDNYWHYSASRQISVKENECNISPFTIIESTINGSNYYQIKYNNYYLVNNNGLLELQDNEDGGSMFVFTNNPNGTYSLAIEENPELKVAIEGNILVLKQNPAEEISQFYFENTNNSEYLEMSAEYSDDGNYIKSVSDYFGNKTTYDIDQSSGLLKSITKNDIKTINEYDSKELLKNTKYIDRFINYEYYDNNSIKKLKTNNKEYNYTYDKFLNIKDIKINNKLLSTSEYDNKNHLRTSRTFGNGQKEYYTYDEYQRLKTHTINNNYTKYEYDNSGNISQISHNNDIYKYYYDLSKKLQKSRCYRDDIFTSEYSYDSNGNIISKKYKLHDKQYNLIDNYNVSFEYNRDNAEITALVNDNKKEMIYDDLGRLSEIKLNNHAIVKYNYLSRGKKTSLYVKSMRILDDLYEYSYDNSYNVIQVKQNGNVIKSFIYDDYNQLIKEVDYRINRYYCFKYDISGNVQSVSEYNLLNDKIIKTDSYRYENNEWKDQLTKFNNQIFTYDEIGNPLTIGNIDLTWSGAGILSSYNDNSRNINVQYKYNSNGVRTSKNVNGNEIVYYLENSKIVIEKNCNSMLYYLWDSHDNVYGIKYNNNIYYFLKNIHNDIIGIVNSSGILVGEYRYDAWGNILDIKSYDSSNIVALNKFRFHSYYYDDETNWYYLKSRYYSPEFKKFVNADAQIISENYTYNLYSFCANNPINNFDYDGAATGGLFGLIGDVLKKTVEVAAGVGTPGTAASAGSAGFWGVVSTVGTALGYIEAAVAIVGLTAAVGYGVKKWADSIDNSPKINPENNYSVYVLANQKGEAEYVGMTKRPDQREIEHKHSLDERKKSLKFVEIKRGGLTRNEARALEEFIMVSEELIAPSGINIRHSVSPYRIDYEWFMKTGEYLYLSGGVDKIEWKPRVLP